MSMINTNKAEVTKQLFHNEEIAVRVTNTSWDKIDYWPENLRTILAFEILEAKLGKPLSEISTKEITYHLSSLDEIKLRELARSIKENGVRVPLVVLDDGTLLDGNRRYFACALLHFENADKPPLEVLSNIPVWVIKSDEITNSQRHKILAESNFVSDYKVAWSNDVKARVIKDYYDDCLSRGLSEEEAYVEIDNVYSIKKSDTKAFVETISLTEEYVARAKSKEQELKLKYQVLKKFVYFWEFRNKAFRGRSALHEDELGSVKQLFFKMMENSCFKNIKQVEPMIRSIRDEYSWGILTESRGAKIGQVELLYRESKAIRSAEDKVRNFTRWLGTADSGSFSSKTRELLGNLSELIEKINKRS